MAVRTGWCWAVVLVAGMACSGALASSEQEDWEEAGRSVTEIMAATKSFIKEARFNEADVKSVIELWPDFDQMADQEEDDSETVIDFESIVDDLEYRRWAASHGLDPEDWLRKTMRITMLLYRDQMQQGMAMAPEQLEQQMAFVERQRDRMSEEMYRQMKEAMVAAAESTRQMREGIMSLPEPTSSERALLDKYRAQLSELMDDGDDEDGEEHYPEDDSWE